MVDFDSIRFRLIFSESKTKLKNGFSKIQTETEPKLEKVGKIRFG